MHAVIVPIREILKIGALPKNKSHNWFHCRHCMTIRVTMDSKLRQAFHMNNTLLVRQMDPLLIVSSLENNT